MQGYVGRLRGHAISNVATVKQEQAGRYATCPNFDTLTLLSAIKHRHELSSQIIAGFTFKIADYNIALVLYFINILDAGCFYVQAAIKLKRGFPVSKNQFEYPIIKLSHLITPMRLHNTDNELAQSPATTDCCRWEYQK